MADASEVVVVYCATGETPFRERASRRMLRAIVASLQGQGRRARVSRYRTHHGRPASPDGALGGRLVFNLAYGYVDPLTGRSFDQPRVARLLERQGARLVGSDAAALAIAQDKRRCAELLAPHGIQSPRDVAADAHPDTLVVRKPRYGACHRGVALLRRAEAGEVPPPPDVLVQEYVDGPEYTVGVVAGRALPPGRVAVAGARGPTALGATRGEPRLERDDGAPPGLGRLAERVGEVLGLRDYYRIDVRMRGDTPVVLDVNGLPNLDPDASFLPMLAAFAGWTYQELVLAVVGSAERRGGASAHG